MLGRNSLDKYGGSPLAATIPYPQLKEGRYDQTVPLPHKPVTRQEAAFNSERAYLAEWRAFYILNPPVNHLAFFNPVTTAAQLDLLVNDPTYLPILEAWHQRNPAAQLVKAQEKKMQSSNKQLMFAQIPEFDPENPNKPLQPLEFTLDFNPVDGGSSEASTSAVIDNPTKIALSAENKKKRKSESNKRKKKHSSEEEEEEEESSSSSSSSSEEEIPKKKKKSKK